MLMSINNFTNIHVKVQFLKQNCEDIKQTNNLFFRPDQYILDCNARILRLSLSTALCCISIIHSFFFLIYLFIYIQDIFIDIYRFSGINLFDIS